jgi:uncharacterized caspase-like protein
MLMQELEYDFNNIQHKINSIMKRALLGLLLVVFSLSGFSQVSESKSGTMQFNISKKGTEQRTFTDASRAPADVTPPVITLQSPALSKDSLTKSDTRTLIVKGKVEDAGGIYEVMVNGIEAKVSADGQFLAEIPQAFGKNTVKVIATDIALNSSKLQFYAERLTTALPDLVTAEAAKPAKPFNTYTITITQPATSTITTPSDKYNLKACVKASAPIKKLMIYRDGSFVNGYLANQIIQKGDCSFQVDEPVSLRLGMNELKIEVYAADDTISKSVTIDYSFDAARNYAILIGNEKYDDPTIPELDEPVKDVAELYATLTKDYNFDPQNVILLKNETKAKIIGTLHELRSKITPADNLLIFYAGHGYWDEGMGVGYWFPRDAEKNNPVNWIPNTDLTNYIEAIKTKHTLLIADACFSGAIFKTRAVFSATYAIEMLYQLDSRKAITSGNMKEVPDKSVFFQYLLKSLKENTNEYLPSEELFSKIRIAVMNNSETVPQYGTIQNVGDEGGDFIFIKRKAVK